jgi:hypothetical protein
MDHVLTECGLRLTYLRDHQAIDELDQDRVLEDLSEDASDDDAIPWLAQCRLADYDHLVLAADRFTGRYLGFLAANNGTTTLEDFLLLQTTFVATAARGQNLMRRMIALAMLRIGGLGAVPMVVAACTRNPLCYRILQDTARRFTRAVFFPDRDSVAINFQAATLAQRIARVVGPNCRFQVTAGTIRGFSPADRRPISSDRQIDTLFGQHMQPADRMLAILDLRAADEATIFEDARRIYRSR